MPGGIGSPASTRGGAGAKGIGAYELASATALAATAKPSRSASGCGGSFEAVTSAARIRPCADDKEQARDVTGSIRRNGSQDRLERRQTRDTLDRGIDGHRRYVKQQLSDFHDTHGTAPP